MILEQKVATKPGAMKQTFARIPRSLIALETTQGAICGVRHRASNFEYGW
jgi:hypothetical protein